MRASAGAALLLAALAFSPAVAGGLPDGFVYLADIAPHIRQDMRYAGGRNFTGARVPGYAVGQCVLAEPATQALSAAGDALAAKGFGLMVLDCYRPRKAVRHFMAWAGTGKGFDARYHPRTDRSALVAQGYIARYSGHSAGYTVDLTLTDRAGKELDMGTPFDFFDPRSATASRDIAAVAARRRAVLVKAMKRAGFTNYSREWWHFSLRRAPKPARAHDFDIIPRGG